MAANYFDKYDQQTGNYFDKYDEAIPKPTAPTAPAEKTGMLRAAADIPVQVGRGIAVGVKALSDAFGADNPVSKAATGVEDWLGGLLSAQAKNDQAEIARIMKDAEDKGVGDQVTAAVKAFATAPVDMLSQALGTAAPVIAGGLVGSIARLGAMGVGAVGAGVGATMGAGTVKGQIYDAVKQELLANKVPEAEAEKRAQEAQAYGGKNLDQILMGAGIGAAEAAFGAERILTGLLRKGAVKPSALPAKYRIPTAAGMEAVPEMAQAAQEQVAQNIALQREGYDVPAMRGVVGQAALEGIAGMGLGAITGAVQRTEAAKPEAEPPKPQAPSEPQQAEAEAPKPVTGEAGIVRPEEETPISREVTKAAEPEVAPPAPAEIAPSAEVADIAPTPSQPAPTLAEEPVAPPAAPQEKPSGAAGMGQRMVNAANRFRDSAVEQFGLTPEQADRAMGRLMKEKVLSLDPVTGQYKLKDGRFWDREVLLRAAGETASQTAPAQSAPIEAKRGAETRIIAGEEKIPAQWEVVEADSVKAAMTEGKTQPRDRKRAVSNAQIMSIAQNPDFDRLSDTSQTMDYGAPTLTQDGAIVGGNGRFEGVNLSYDTEAGQRYKQSLLENAERLGLDPEQVRGMQKPILVRRITQPADTRKLAIQSNIVAGLELSDMEQAALDAERMAGLDRLEISEAGDIPITSRNMDVLRSAFKDYTTEEMGKMMSAEGGLSQAGLRRVRNAILYKAYGKTDTLARLVESPDPDLKNVGTALMRASGGMSQMMDAIRSGAIPAEYDIIEDLTGAIETLSSLRASGTKVQDFLMQSELFGDGISGSARSILRFMDNNLRSAASITKYLNDYAQSVLSAESATGGLFGETQLPTKQETLERAAQKYEAQRAATKAQRTLEEQPAGEVRPEARVQPEGEGRAVGSDEEVKKSLRATPAQQVSDFEQTLRTALNKFGLKDVGVKLIDGMTEEGSYAQQLIRIAADSANPIRTLRHEAIHALRELGFFTPQQWQSLSKMAKDKWIDQYLKQRNVDGKPLKAGEESRYDAYLREYNGDMEKITEEAVADAFADFDATKPPSGLMQALLARMRNLFQAIKSALTKVESPEQIFGKVERGELRAGERGVAGEKKSLRDRATENFRRWFGDSKVVDENGEPLVVYHGTAFDFDTFKRTSSGEFGPAIYFTDNPREAGEYGIGQQRPGVNIIPAYLSMQNPYTYGVDKFWQEFGKDDGDHAAVERARNAGYDGVIAKRDDIYYDQSTRNFVNTGKQLTHYIVFDPNQIKSAIGNNGEYSITNADIRKSLRSEKPTSTPTAAGQKALDTINQLGMGVQPPPDSKIKEAKATIKKMVEDPELTKKTALDAFRKFMDKFEGWALSADAPFQNALRRGFKRDMVGMEEFLGSLLDSSQSQAVGADAVSTQAVLRGRAEYDTEVRKWVAVDDKNNLTKLSSQLEQIAEKYGLTKEEAQRIAHTYFVATNYNGILKRNERIKAEVEKLREEGKDEEADEKADALVFVSPKQAAMVEPGKALISTIPELSNLVETWDGIRKNFVRTLVSTGLWSPEYATSMINNIDYVPFYREEQIEANEGPREMIRGLQVKAKEHKLKGSEDSVNDVFDNMARWMQYAMNRSIRNHKALQMIDIASEMQEGDRMMATKVSEAKRGMNIVKVWRDGKQELYDMADPIWLDAFQSLGTVSIPAIKYFTSIANMLRRSVVAYPLFSIGQVPQDAVAAIFSSGLKPRFALKIPYLAVKEFIKTLRGTSETHKELKRFGAVGVRDFNANVLRQDAEILAGIKAPRGVKDKVMYALDHIAMSADNAVRQAVYTASLEAGLQKSEAMEKAFDVINFRRRGSSKLLNLMGQTVPFFYAYLSAQRVAYRTLTGTGISPTTRKAALETLAQTTAAVMALSFLYSMANGDDEEYEKTPGTIRDRSLLIPGSGGVRIPLRPDFFLLPKIIAEHTYQLLSDNGYSDGAKFRKGMYEVLANSVLSPNPVPQAIKPLVEIGINYSFFEGRPIVGFFEQNKEAGRQFSENTSEMAKLFGNLGASPEKVDHFIRGYFGSVGGLFLWGTNFFIEGEPGVERPSITFEEAIQTMPGVGAFRQKPNENALKVDFYELRDAVAKAKNTYDDIKLRSPEGLEAFIEDETNVARLAMEKGVTKIADHLSKIRRARQQISNMPDSEMSSEEKQERIKELKEVEVELLKSVDVKSLRAQARL